MTFWYFRLNLAPSLWWPSVTGATQAVIRDITPDGKQIAGDAWYFSPLLSQGVLLNGGVNPQNSAVLFPCPGNCWTNTFSFPYSNPYVLGVNLKWVGYWRCLLNLSVNTTSQTPPLKAARYVPGRTVAPSIYRLDQRFLGIDTPTGPDVHLNAGFPILADPALGPSLFAPAVDTFTTNKVFWVGALTNYEYFDSSLNKTVLETDALGRLVYHWEGGLGNPWSADGMPLDTNVIGTSGAAFLLMYAQRFEV